MLFLLFDKVITKGDYESKITIPIQLFELLFGIDWNRDVVHPIPTNIRLLFKDNGFKVAKLRNKYIVYVKRSKNNV